MKKAAFITFEGPEGSGKSTIISKIKSHFDQEGIKMHLTREPGGSKIAENIRNIILNKENINLDPRAEALLFAASRSQHYYEIVEPNILNGVHVICDRFIDSSLAYQGYARDLGIDEVYSINKFAIGNTLPDLTIYIDLDVEVGLSRVQGRDKVDRLDLESIDFHKRVREGYLKVSELHRDRIIIVDGHKPLDELTEEILGIVSRYIYEL